MGRDDTRLTGGAAFGPREKQADAPPPDSGDAPPPGEAAFSPWSGRLVGAPVARVEDPRILTGGGRYVDDLRLPGTLHAAFLRSPHAHARIGAVDAGPAERAAGVRTIVHGRSPAVQALGDIRPTITTPGIACPARPVLARDVVRFVGEPLAVVVAESRYRAEDALELLRVDYELLPPVVDAEAAMDDGAAQIHPDVPGNRYVTRQLEFGEVDRAFAEADVVVDWQRFRSPRYSGAPIETRGVLAAPSEDGRITIWTSSQVPHRVREVVAESLGLPQSVVRVVVPDVGGGFGLKAQVYPEEVIIPWLARTLGTPVKWVEDRREHLLAASHARQQVVEARLAAAGDGMVTAIDARIVCDVGAYGIYPMGPGLEPQGTSAMIPGPYQIRTYRCRVLGVATNKSPEGPYRGVGLPVATLVHERLMDLLAGRLGLGPEVVRRRNLVPADAFPYTSVTGMVYDSGSYVECLDRAAAALDLPVWRRRQQDVNRSGGPLRLGIGFGCYVEYTGVGAATFQARGMLSVPGSDGTRLRVEPDGTVTVTSSLSEMGQGIATTLRQLAADGLGLPLESIRFENTDTDHSPPGTGTFASRSAILGAGTLAPACRSLRERILEVAAEHFEVAVGDVELLDGRVVVRGVPERVATLAELAARAPGRLDASAEWEGPPASFPHATHIGVIEVDTETGWSRFLAYVVAEDCGKLINPLIVDGQVHGAVAQGLGGALLEELQYDQEGQLLNASFMDYLLPTAGDLPTIEVHHLETPAPLVPGGFKGVGEGGTLASPAVVANAISDALGVPVNTLPAAPERVRGWWNGAERHGVRRK